jgi:hypothetical protein
MMAVNAWSDVWYTTFGYALALASLTQTACPLPYDALDLVPSFY